MEDERPRIEFPCDDYPIKVIGASSATLRETVVAIVRSHDRSFEASSVEEKKSRAGNYTSVRLSIRATGESQLRALHAELMAHPLVRLVL